MKKLPRKYVKISDNSISAGHHPYLKELNLDFLTDRENPWNGATQILIKILHTSLYLVRRDSALKNF